MAAHGNTYDFDLSENDTLDDLVLLKAGQHRPKVVASVGLLPFLTGFAKRILRKR